MRSFWEAILITIFCQKSAKRKPPKKYFHIFFLCLTWGLHSDLTSHRPAYYLLDYGDFSLLYNSHSHDYSNLWTKVLKYKGCLEKVPSGLSSSIWWYTISYMSQMTTGFLGNFQTRNWYLQRQFSQYQIKLYGTIFLIVLRGLGTLHWIWYSTHRLSICIKRLCSTPWSMI